MKAGEISGKASADSFSFFFFLPSFGSCKQKQKDFFTNVPGLKENSLHRAREMAVTI